MVSHVWIFRHGKPRNLTSHFSPAMIAEHFHYKEHNQSVVKRKVSCHDD